MKFLRKFILNESKVKGADGKEWDLKDIDPFDEEYWEEEKFLDRKNYINYDNVEAGHSNYPEDAPVLLKEGDEHRRGLTVAILEPYELGFVYNARNNEPTYNVFWSRRGRNRDHYSYDLMYHKDYIPSDWTPGKVQGFTMGDKVLYELVVSWSERLGRLTYTVHRKDVANQRRNIMINNASDYMANQVSLQCFREFLNKKYGYLQDCSNRGSKYNKDIMYFTNEFPLDGVNVKGFTTLIKRRMSAIQSKYTRGIKKINETLLGVKKRMEKILEFNFNKINDLNFKNPRYNSDWIGIRFNDDIYLDNVRFENYRDRKYIRLGWNSWDIDKKFDKRNQDYVIVSNAHSVALAIDKSKFEDVKDVAFKEFKEEIDVIIENKVEDSSNKIKTMENKIKVMEDHKKVLGLDKRKFQLIDVIGDYLT